MTIGEQPFEYHGKSISTGQYGLLLDERQLTRHSVLDPPIFLPFEGFGQDDIFMLYVNN